MKDNDNLARTFLRNKPIVVVGLDKQAFTFAKHLSKLVNVIAYDAESTIVLDFVQQEFPQLNGQDEVPPSTSLKLTSDIKDIEGAVCYVLAIAPQMNHLKKPDLRHLKVNLGEIASVLEPQSSVLFHTTIFPGAIEKVCIPILQRISRLTVGKNLNLCYVSEPIMMREKYGKSIAKVCFTAVTNPELTQLMTYLFQGFDELHLSFVSSITDAECTAVFYKVKKDVALAFKQEMSTIFKQMGISSKDLLIEESTYELVEHTNSSPEELEDYGRQTSFLIHLAKEKKVSAKLLTQVRRANDLSVAYVIYALENELRNSNLKELSEMSVLVLGVAAQKNTKNVRHSFAASLCLELDKITHELVIHDPLISPLELKRVYGLLHTAEPNQVFDLIVLAVDHDLFFDLSKDYFVASTKPTTLFFDLKGNFKSIISNLGYAHL